MQLLEQNLDMLGEVSRPWVIFLAENAVQNIQPPTISNFSDRPLVKSCKDSPKDVPQSHQLEHTSLQCCSELLREGAVGQCYTYFMLRWPRQTKTKARTPRQTIGILVLAFFAKRQYEACTLQAGERKIAIQLLQSLPGTLGLEFSRVSCFSIP